jgi:hypothetical protein
MTDLKALEIRPISCSCWESNSTQIVGQHHEEATTDPYQTLPLPFIIPLFDVTQSTSDGVLK